jgi:uncharacterized protein YggE
MKTINPGVLFMVGLAALGSPCARAQVQPPPRLINVSGSADIKVAPDEVNLSVGVVTHNESLDLARKENDESVSRALAFLAQNGVKAKDIKTDYISIEPVYLRASRGDALPAMKPAYYNVRKGIGIRVADVHGFDALYSGLIDSGVNEVTGVEFRTTELRKYKDQARATAIRAAKDKAEAMAAELGVKVGKPWSINVNDWSGFGYRMGANSSQNLAQAAAGVAGDEGPSFSAGEISVTANVSVSFLIE